MKHTHMRRILSLLCAAALLLSLSACSPVETVKGWFTSKQWQDDKPYESYNLDKYITLGEYKGVSAEINPLTEESLFKEAQLYFHENGLPIGLDDDPSKTAVADGDIIHFSFEGSRAGVSEETLASMKSDSHYLTIGSGNFIAGFEEKLIGKQRGKEYSIKVTFPAEYGVEELNGKEVTFKGKIFAIGKESKEVSDDMVKMLTGGQIETGKDFMEWVEEQTKNSNRNNAFQAAYANAEIKQIPSREQTYWDDQLVQDAQRQGMDVESYLQASGYSNGLEAYKTEARDESIKMEMFAYAIAKEEDITVTEDEIGELLEEIRENNGDTGTDAELYSKYGGKGRLLRSLLQNKVADFIVDNAVAAAAE